jgi:hypothetical protein
MKRAHRNPAAQDVVLRVGRLILEREQAAMAAEATSHRNARPVVF